MAQRLATTALAVPRLVATDDRVVGVAYAAVIALPNEPSVRLHERHGFVRIGQLVDAGYKLGGWHDVGFWQCSLRGGDDVSSPPQPVEVGDE